MYCQRTGATRFAATIPFRVPIEICTARSCKVNSKGTGARWYLSGLGRRARRYPSEILFKIGSRDGASQDENGQLDSWTVGGRATSLSNSLPCCTIVVVVFHWLCVCVCVLVWLARTRRVTSGNEGGSQLFPVAFAVTSSFHGVARMSLSSYGFVFGSIDYSIGTSPVPLDFL